MERSQSRVGLSPGAAPIAAAQDAAKLRPEQDSLAVFGIDLDGIEVKSGCVTDSRCAPNPGWQTTLRRPSVHAQRIVWIDMNNVRAHQIAFGRLSASSRKLLVDGSIQACARTRVHILRITFVELMEKISESSIMPRLF